MESHSKRYRAKYFGLCGAEKIKKRIFQLVFEALNKNVEGKRPQRDPSRIAQIAHKFNKNDISLFHIG